MADGNNQDEALTQAKAKIEELTKRIAELTKALETQTGIADNAEKKFKEMSNETGENRKAIAEAGRELVEARKVEREARTAVDTLSKELNELKVKLGPKAGQEQSAVEDKRTAEEIQASMTDDEQKVADEAWKNADEATRKLVVGDDAKRKEFLLAAKEAARESGASDLSDWRKKPAQGSGGKPRGDAEDSIKRLFDTARRRARNLPDGSQGGSTRQRAGAGVEYPGKRTSVLIG